MTVSIIDDKTYLRVNERDPLVYGLKVADARLVAYRSLGVYTEHVSFIPYGPDVKHDQTDLIILECHRVDREVTRSFSIPREARS